VEVSQRRVATGKHFELAVLAPTDNTGMGWRLIATSAPVAVTTATGSDAVNGPFRVQIPIDVGERIALMPVDDLSTPIEAGTQGADGLRYFSQPFNGGLGSSQQVASTADNTYTLTNRDIGFTMRFQVTASNSDGDSQRQSARPVRRQTPQSSMRRRS
jgi:hypothetical protein